ncbi:MAG: hypothetical protein WC836_18660 [Desulfobacula sp.]
MKKIDLWIDKMAIWRKTMRKRIKQQAEVIRIVNSYTLLRKMDQMHIIDGQLDQLKIIMAKEFQGYSA